MAEKHMNYSLSLSANEVRRHDWDRFLCTLFAPVNMREDLFTLLAFNSELARNREMVTDPLIGEMRLQWWRDNIERVYNGSLNKVSGHYIMEYLPDIIRSRDLSKNLFYQLIEARLMDLSDQPPANMSDLLDYTKSTSSILNLLQLEILGCRKDFESYAEALGTAWALTGLMLAVPALRRQGRSPLPQEIVMADQKLGGTGENIYGAVKTVCLAAEQYLEKVEWPEKTDRSEVRSIFLLGPLCRSYLKKLSSVEYDPFSPDLQQSRVLKQISLWFRALTGAY